MSLEAGAGLVLAVLTAGYLLFALLHPEKF